jgi:hypothetical protein
MERTIRQRFNFNLKRVENLVHVYDELEGTRSKTLSQYRTDVLRSAVVLLHAAVEDLVRCLMALHLPKAPPEKLEDIPADGGKGKGEKLTLPALARARGRTVDDVVFQAVTDYLKTASFSNVSRVREALKRIDVDPARIATELANLGPLMDRRHRIVHRGDRADVSGDHHGALEALSREDVQAWLAAARALGASLLPAPRRVRKARALRRATKVAPGGSSAPAALAPILSWEALVHGVLASQSPPPRGLGQK